MGDIRLETQGACKKFFRKRRDSAQYFDAVAPTDLQLAAGELVVLKGRSGSGKTTLLNMMAGLLEPSEGTVTLDGQNLYELDDAALSRLRNVTLPYLMYRDDDGCESRALELLENLGIRQLADSYPSELSGGESRRVCVARALMCAPDVLFADEPTGNLDDASTQVVLEMLRSYADAGAAVLVVTHEQMAEEYADHVLKMDAGVIEARA